MARLPEYCDEVLRLQYAHDSHTVASEVHVRSGKVEGQKGQKI
jgi:hypothetical protein